MAFQRFARISGKHPASGENEGKFDNGRRPLLYTLYPESVSLADQIMFTTDQRSTTTQKWDQINYINPLLVFKSSIPYGMNVAYGPFGL